MRRVALVWNGAPERRPKPEDVVLTFFDAEAPNNIPTWWNQTVLREAGKPEVSSDGTTYTFTIPVDIFGLVVGVRGGQSASAYEVPVVRALHAGGMEEDGPGDRVGVRQVDGWPGLQRKHRGV